MDAQKKQRVLAAGLAALVALTVGLGAWAVSVGKDTQALKTVADEEPAAALVDTGSAQREAKEAARRREEASDAAKAQEAQDTTSDDDASHKDDQAKKADDRSDQEPASTGGADDSGRADDSGPQADTSSASVELGTERATSPAPAPAPEPTTVTVHVSVDGTPAGGGRRDATVTLPVGATVYDALMSSGAGVNARSTGYGTYVAAIDGLAEFDHGSMSGWVYAVNGVEPQTACSNYTLSDGDSVVWTYVNVEY